jgi:hypothetical protein
VATLTRACLLLTIAACTSSTLSLHCVCVCGGGGGGRGGCCSACVCSACMYVCVYEWYRDRDTHVYAVQGQRQLERTDQWFQAREQRSEWPSQPSCRHWRQVRQQGYRYEGRQQPCTRAQGSASP